MNQLFCWHEYELKNFSETDHLWEGVRYKTTINLIYQCKKCTKVKVKKGFPFIEEEKLKKLLSLSPNE